MIRCQCTLKRSHSPSSSSVHCTFGIRHRIGIMSWTLRAPSPNGMPRVMVCCHSPGSESILWFDTPWHTVSGNTAVGNHRPSPTRPFSSRGRCDLKFPIISSSRVPMEHRHETKTVKTSEYQCNKTRFSMCNGRRSGWHGIDVWARDENAGQW
jgi:hypothetical protein